MESKQIIILGGGAAGFFAALAAKDANPEARVSLFEKSAALLSKVRISGGGRCNVTHACFDSRQLVLNYPRGNKELIGPFTRFQPRDTIQWFTSRNVELKTESDGRLFPVTDQSSTIIDCLLNEAKKLKVEIVLRQRIKEIQKNGDKFLLTSQNDEKFECDCLLLASGSQPDGHAFAKNFGHSIIDPVPSLFTLNVPNSPLHDLAGISVPEAAIKLVGTPIEQSGPLLITHWGFSGPAALKLSAWGARIFHQHHYKMPISIDWLPHIKREEVLRQLHKIRAECPSQSIGSKPLFQLPKNLWKRLVALSDIEEAKKFAGLGNDAFNKLADRLKSGIYQVDGKTTHKEEFVTCGGVALDEVNFKTMESRLCKGLYFAGEILDIDAVTGGFNFQNAWTTGWIAGHSMSN
jgi:predicted Rossmann fold flavoprotein